MEINVGVATIFAQKVVPPPGGTRFELRLKEHATVLNMIENLGVSRSLAGPIIVNKKKSALDQVLKDKDQVSIVPAISGG
ncbi:MAG: MoaD/ThiS family protein [Actinomycetota bacterium]|nr:MoaD/ThiS family protein [Actinomycetota bacterium]